MNMDKRGKVEFTRLEAEEKYLIALGSMEPDAPMPLEPATEQMYARSFCPIEKAPEDVSKPQSTVHQEADDFLHALRSIDPMIQSTVLLSDLDERLALDGAISFGVLEDLGLGMTLLQAHHLYRRDIDFNDFKKFPKDIWHNEDALREFLAG